ncbi:hypothetical protein [Enterococcus lactis]|uniref:hypothetical protein n=1 Tax=Enterococcus lactis TaxID=357441 RepID=UPI004041F7BF
MMMKLLEIEKIVNENTMGVSLTSVLEKMSYSVTNTNKLVLLSHIKYSKIIAINYKKNTSGNIEVVLNFI